jgi:uncharacterized membrane protein YvlD (DUF360 family)
MTKTLFIFINVLIYCLLVTVIDGLQVGSFGENFALLAGGLIFALLAFAVEPVLSFFRFPLNFWGLLVVGFILNLAMFILLSTGLMPSILVIEEGSIGSGFSPLPVPELELVSPLMTATAAAVVGTLLQIITRRLGN